MPYYVIAIALLALATAVLLFLLVNKNKKIQQLTSNVDEVNDVLTATTLEHNQVKAELIINHDNEINSLKEQTKGHEHALLEINKKYAPLISRDAEIVKRIAELDKLNIQLFNLNSRYKQALDIHSKLEREIGLYKDILELGEYGLYQAKYSFDIPEQYKVELEAIYRKQKSAIELGNAIVCTTEWTVGESKAEGRKMTSRYMKLMLYAFNGECDALIAKVKWNNAMKTRERIRKVFETVNKLGQSHQTYITELYLELKLDELAVTYEYEQKKYEEKEEQGRIREQMREEEKAQKEFERAEREAEDEERRYARALEKAKSELTFANRSEIEDLNQKISFLQHNLQKAQEKKMRAISQAQMTRVGHIYVISNIGSFGEDVYKIGMTRRLDPLDRVRELGDASVPFQFDVHAIIYSEDAPSLEYELHRKFKDRRLNMVNGRKEFFKVALDEVEAFILQQSNASILFTKLAEAKEYRETLKYVEQLNNIAQSTETVSKFPNSLV
jgi:uncharacterized protein YoxC